VAPIKQGTIWAQIMVKGAIVCITALNHTCLSEKVDPIIEIVQHILMETLTSLRIQAVWAQAHYKLIKKLLQSKTILQSMNTWTYEDHFNSR
jgi:hypothetical protein